MVLPGSTLNCKPLENPKPKALAFHKSPAQPCSCSMLLAAMFSKREYARHQNSTARSSSGMCGGRMQASGCGVGVEGFETGGFLKDSHATVEFIGVQVLRIYISLACQGIR